jgi:phosphate transport system substrate-binding protein
VKRTLIAVGLFVFALSTVHAQKLTGAGATFPYPIYSKWFSEYAAAHPGVQINYQSIGSGGGIKQTTAGLVDFGASDVPPTDEQLAQSKTKLTLLPTVLGAVVPVFNVPGVSDIKFSPDVLADIYLGKISTWNDARIAKINPGVTLPGEKIIVVHRSDGSGTTFIFTDYLSKVSSDWANGPGKGASPSWPVGVGGKGNEGVAGLVRQLPGAIGYVELIYASSRRPSPASPRPVRRSSRCPQTTASPSPTPPAREPIRSPASPGCWCRSSRPIRPRVRSSRTC